jgi:hypothetical protein
LAVIETLSKFTFFPVGTLRVTLTILPAKVICSAPKFFTEIILKSLLFFGIRKKINAKTAKTITIIAKAP